MRARIDGIDGIGGWQACIDWEAACEAAWASARSTAELAALLVVASTSSLAFAL